MADPFSYRDVLTLWDRAQARGEQRSLPDYARFLNETYETDVFSQGERDGWWTRASTRADQVLEESVVGQAFGGAGAALGGMIGYEDLGREIGVQTPRMLLNTAPLFVPGVGLVAGSLMTAGATGAHTYAQLGDAKTAAISGLTAGAMPWMGKVGGALGKRVSGAPMARGLLTEEGAAATGGVTGNPFAGRFATTPGQFAAEYAGSQGVQLGTEAVGTYVQDPTRPIFSEEYAAEVILGQVPFTALDVYHGSKALRGRDVTKTENGVTTTTRVPGLPTPKDVKRFTVAEEAPVEGKIYQPVEGSDEDNQHLTQVLAETEAIARGDDPKAKVEANGKVISRVLTPYMVKVKGYTEDGQRVYIDSIEGNASIQLPEHKTVFVNAVEGSMKMLKHEGYEVEFEVPITALKPAKFGVKPKRTVADPNQPGLPVQADPAPIPFPSEYEGGEMQTIQSPALRGMEEDDGAVAVRRDNAFLAVPEETKVAVATRAKAPGVLRIGENLAKSQDLVLDFVQGKINVDPTGSVVRLGNTDVALSGEMDETRFRKTTQLPKEIVEAMKETYPEAWTKGGKVNVNALVKGLKERPMVEVKKLGGGRSDEAARLMHELDTRFPGWSARQPAEMQTEELQMASRARDLEQTRQMNTEESERSRYQFLGPKSEQDMLGYVEGLVRVPMKEEGTGRVLKTGEQGRIDKKTSLYAGPHFGSEDNNVLAFFRGYEETLADGRKVFHVIEVQSDWAQGVRQAKESNLRRRTQANDEDIASAHPLLASYETLALKAAIDHARSIGADAVMVSDGETAMMTEGHDKQTFTRWNADKDELQTAFNLPSRYKILTNEDTGLQPLEVGAVLDTQTNEIVAKFRKVEYGIALRPYQESGTELQPAVKTVASAKTTTGVQQEKGMRLHYDTTLPSTLAKLTGDKGEKVEMGVHKNAGRALTHEEIQQQVEALDEFRRRGEITGTQYLEQRQELLEKGKRIVGGSPVFRNPDGTPKSSITGRLYTLDKITRGLETDDTLSLKEAVIAYNQAEQRKVAALRKASAPVDDPERVADINTPENKARIDTLIKDGMRPTKALEKVQQIIANRDLSHTERDQAIAVIVAQRAERRGKFQGREKTQYAEKAITREDGKRFEASRSEVELELQNRGLNIDEYSIRNSGRGKFYAVEKLTRKVSLDIKGEHGGSLEEVIPDQSTQAVEDERNSERRQDFLTVEPEDTMERLDSLEAVRRNAGMVARSLQSDEVSIIRVLDATEKLMKGEKAEFGEDDIELAGRINGIMRKLDEERIRALVARSHPLGDEVRFAAFRGENGAEAWMDWFVAHPNSSYLGQFLSDLRSKAGVKVRSTNDINRGFEYDNETKTINIPNLPVDDADAFRLAQVVAEEYAHRVTIDKMRSKDAASVEFTAELRKIMKSVEGSKHIPPRIRRAVEGMREGAWLKRFRTSKGSDMDAKLMSEYEKLVGNKKQADEYRKITYALLDPEEFVGGVFGTQELPFILSATKVQQSYAKTALQWLSKTWSKMFGVKTENDSALGEFLVRFDRFMDGKTSEGYAARSYVADYLSSRIGVRPAELGARTEAVMKLVATGDLSQYSTERVDMTLDAKAVGKATIELPRQEVARHREIAERLQEDLEVAKGTREQFKRLATPLYHGSPQAIVGKLKPGLMSGVLSLAVDPKVANYFASGQRGYFDDSFPSSVSQVYANVKNTYDYRNLEHVALAKYASDKDLKALKAGDFRVIETYQDTLKQLGFDSFYTDEGGLNLHVFDSSQVIYPSEMLSPKNTEAKLSSLLSALDRQDRAIRRYDDLDNFDPAGWRDRIRSVDRPPPDPADPVPDLPSVQLLVGLRSGQEVRTEKSTEKLNRGIIGSAVKFIEKNVLLQQHLSRVNPAHAARSDVLQQEHGMYNERQAALNFARFVDMQTGKLSDVAEKNYEKVLATPRLSRVASDIRLIINEKQKQKLNPGWDDVDVQKRLNRLTSREDREAVKMWFEGEVRRYNVWNQTVLTTEFYDRLIPTDAATTISAREGVLPKPAKQMAQNFYSVLKSLQDAPNPAAVEQLRGLAAQLSPATSAKVIEQIQGALTQAKEYLDFNRSRQVYFNEQRYGKAQALLTGRDGQDIRISRDSYEELNKLVEQKVREGARLLYVVDKEDTQAPNGQQRVIRFVEEIEARELARSQNNTRALEGADAATIAQVQESGIAESVRQAFAAAKPLPGTQRRLVEGRETLDLSNDDEFYNRANNWMRHALTRSEDTLQRLHPEIAGDIELKKFGDQMLEAFLTPDNAVARKLTSMTFFYKLGFEFGNSFVESFQHATTGMQALIAQTGSTGDALELLRKASHDKWKYTFTNKWRDDDQAWFIQRLKEQGEDVAATVNDIHDPDEFARRRIARGNVGQRAVGAVDNMSRRWSGVMQQYGNIVVGLAAFDHARGTGMDLDAAYNFARGVKNLGMYTGGKSQRPGIFRISTKPVPQLMASMQTYAMGWFGQMYSDWKIGFSKSRPAGYTKIQVEGAKKAFIYGIAAQASLAGALGMPGMGQGLALLKQATGFDIAGWLRSNLAGLFDEDQEGGGLVTGVALNGVLSVTTPFDPSSRISAGIPLIPVDPYKGLTMERLAGAPGGTVSDFLEGVHALATGNRAGWEKALPNALKRPARLLMDDGDVRDERGGMLYKLSPMERVFTAIGLPPTRIQRSRELSSAARNASDRAQRKREQLADELGSLGGNPAALQQRIQELTQEGIPQQEVVSLVKAAAKRYDRQNRPFDWREATNVGAELNGARSARPSTVGLGRRLEQDFLKSAGLQVRPNPRADARALLIDQLINSGGASTEAEARQVLEMQRGRRSSSVLNIPGLQ